MEQVKRYKMSNCCGEDDRCQFAKEYVLAADHARCVQDVRRMAERLQSYIRVYQLRPGESLLNPDYTDAQAVLDRWKEVQG